MSDPVNVGDKTIPVHVHKLLPVDRDEVYWQARLQLLVPTPEMIAAISGAGLYREMVDHSILLYGTVALDGAVVAADPHGLDEAMRDEVFAALGEELASMLERVDHP